MNQYRPIGCYERSVILKLILERRTSSYKQENLLCHHLGYGRSPHEPFLTFSTVDTKAGDPPTHFWNHYINCNARNKKVCSNIIMIRNLKSFFRIVWLLVGLALRAYLNRMRTNQGRCIITYVLPYHSAMSFQFISCNFRGFLENTLLN